MTGSNGFTGFDDVTPTSGIAIGDQENKALLMFIGNATLEVRQNTVALRAIREEIQALNRRYDVGIASRVIEECERNHAVNEGNEVQLRSMAAK